MQVVKSNKNSPAVKTGAALLKMGSVLQPKK